jgi:hypothetical protein
MGPVVDLAVEPGLRYTEELQPRPGNRPVRVCRLVGPADTAIGQLEVHSYRTRFGAVAVETEGLGGVEVQPRFRRRGHVGRLLRLALDGMAQRVDVAVVSEGIRGLYEKFGFVTAVGEGHLLVGVRDVETAARAAPAGPAGARPTIRTGSPDDLPAIVTLYNATHAQRPWTRERPADWNRLKRQTTWSPGSELVVAETADALVGYAICVGRAFGDGRFALTVDELAADSPAAALGLMVNLAERAWRMRVGEFVVREPLDSPVGRLARQLGCGYVQEFPAAGGMLARILNRPGLLRSLAPELERRCRPEPLGPVLAALATGELVGDDRSLVRLLLGYSSAADARMFTAAIPEHYRRICAALFPGGGAAALPAPYAHMLDRY